MSEDILSRLLTWQDEEASILLEKIRSSSLRGLRRDGFLEFPSHSLAAKNSMGGVEVVFKIWKTVLHQLAKNGELEKLKFIFPKVADEAMYQLWFIKGFGVDKRTHPAFSNMYRSILSGFLTGYPDDMAMALKFIQWVQSSPLEKEMPLSGSLLPGPAIFIRDAMIEALHLPFDNQAAVQLLFELENSENKPPSLHSLLEELFANSSGSADNGLSKKLQPAMSINPVMHLASRKPDDADYLARILEFYLRNVPSEKWASGYAENMEKFFSWSLQQGLAEDYLNNVIGRVEYFSIHREIGSHARQLVKKAGMEWGMDKAPKRVSGHFL